MIEPQFTRLRALADPDHLPALSPEYLRAQPALGLGPLDPAPRILLLYGSLRERSYSRLVVEETARLLQHFGCKTRIFDPSDLPLPDQIADDGGIERAERTGVAQVRRVGGKDQVEIVEILAAELAAAERRDIDAAAARLSLRTRIGGVADMPVAGPRRIDDRVDASLCESGARGALGERRAADVAEAEEKDRGFCNCSIVAHVARPLHKVEPTFNLRLGPALLAMRHKDNGSGRGLPDGG